MAENDRERARRIEENEEYDAGEEELTPIPGDTEEEQLDSTQEAPAGFVMVDTDTEEEDVPLDAEEQEDFISVGTNPDGVMDEISQFTTDKDIQDDFEERQNMNTGSDELLEKLQEQTDRKPSLSGGDIDAAWEDAVVSGEETAGGTVATPDQDVVEELGEALGVEYADDEPLDTYAKLRDRDRNRWEMDPDSANDSDLEELDEDLEDEEFVDEDLDIYDVEDEDDLLDEELDSNTGPRAVRNDELIRGEGLMDEDFEEDEDIIDADYDELTDEDLDEEDLEDLLDEELDDEDY